MSTILLDRLFKKFRTNLSNSIHMCNRRSIACQYTYIYIDNIIVNQLLIVCHLENIVED